MFKINHSLIDILVKYRSFHKKKQTKITHVVGIPLITFAVLIFLSWFEVGIERIFHLDFVWIAIVLVSLYYVWMNFALGLIMFVIFLIMAFFATLLSLDIPTWPGFWVGIICFVVGAIFQAVGHAIEGKKPIMMDNLGMIFIAPLFITLEIFFWIGWFKPLEEKIKAKEEPTPVKKAVPKK